MSQDIKDVILDALGRICRNHKKRTAGIVYPWLDAVEDMLRNLPRLQMVYDLLEDDESRRSFTWLLGFRLAGYMTQDRELSHTIMPQLIGPAAWERMTRQAADLPEADLEGHLTVDVIENYILDGYNLAATCAVARGDVVLDLGAYNGNSSIVFSRAVGRTGKVYAFEPNPETQPMLARNLGKAGCENVEIVPEGASDRVGTVRFSNGGAASHVTASGGIEARITTVDTFVRDKFLSQVDFIKFDIEGHELQAIAGAADVIRYFRPKLAVSIYHLHHDPHAIPLAIKDICPWYRFYVRHNNVGEGELVLFCNPIERVRAQ